MQAVELVNFSYRYPDGTPALSDITLGIGAGENVAVIGPNGAGKSTLLLAMAGLIKGTGKVFVGGTEVSRGNMKKIRRTIGCCLENPEDQLFMPTLFDDVAFGPLNMGLSTEQVKAAVAGAPETVGLADMAEKAPHHLSAGQKRAAAIATVLSMSPAIIVMDEPDGSLDPRNRRKLIKLLAGLEQTLVIATCNMNFAAAVAERAVVLDGGRVVADGCAGEVMGDAELMSRCGLEVPATCAGGCQHRT